MKNKLLLLIIATIFCACSKEDDFNTNTDEFNGSQIEVTEYIWKFGEKPDYGDLYEKFTYNKFGKLTELETNYYNSMVDSRVSYTTKYIYDNKNNLIEKNEYFMNQLLEHKYKYTTNDIDSIATMHKYDGEGKLDEAWEYTYDSNRRLTKAKQTYSYFSAYEDHYSYNGNDVTIKKYNCENGELFGTTEYTYDEHNNLEQKVWINGETNKVDVQILNEYKYNEENKLTRQISHGYYSKDDLTYKDYTYDPDGNITNIHVTYSYKTEVSDLDYCYLNL